MEQCVIYSSGNQSEKSLNSLVESYLNLLSEKQLLEVKIEKVKRNIRDTESAINYELRGNTNVGKIVRAGDRIFCCLKGEGSPPVMIEMQE